MINEITAYIEDLRKRGYKKHSAERKRDFLLFFKNWCEDRSITQVENINRQTLSRYQKHLYIFRYEDGSAMSIEGQRRKISEVKHFFEYLYLNGHIEENPAIMMDLPRRPKVLAPTLTAQQIEKVIDTVNTETPEGVRDRALLELIYATGLRREEAENLKVEDFDEEGESLHIVGMGRNRTRKAPLMKRTIAWMKRYLKEARPRLKGEQEEKKIFLYTNGKAMTSAELGHKVITYIRAAGIEKRGGFRLLRNSITVLLIEGGMDLRYIQEIMGHRALNSTYLYTKMSISKLKEVHEKTHPGAVMKKDIEELEEL